MLNVITITVFKMTLSHCAGTVQMREESSQVNKQASIAPVLNEQVRKRDKKVRRDVI